MMVFRRDRGVCRGCGLDCERFVQAMNALLGYCQDDGSHRGWEPDCGCAYCGRRRATGFRIGAPYWENDHIRPVAEGGGECGLAGMRTLCLPCHKRATAALAARLARRRSGDG